MSYFFDLDDIENKMAGTGYSTAVGKWVEGDKIIFGKICIPAGTEAEPHTHPNEQFFIVLQGEADYVIAGEKKRVGQDCIVRVPANTVHSLKIVGDEDFIFITAKDTAWGIIGMKYEDEKGQKEDA